MAQTAKTIAVLELGAAGNSVWIHGSGFATLAAARQDRFARLEERRRWDEQHQKLRELMLMYKAKAAYNSGMASRYQAAQTRLAKFEEAAAAGGAAGAESLDAAQRRAYRQACGHDR